MIFSDFHSICDTFSLHLLFTYCAFIFFPSFHYLPSVLLLFHLFLLSVVFSPSHLCFHSSFFPLFLLSYLLSCDFTKYISSSFPSSSHFSPLVPLASSIFQVSPSPLFSAPHPSSSPTFNAALGFLLHTRQEGQVVSSN